VALVASSKDRAPSLGVLLLADVRTAFTDAATDRLSTSDLLDALHKVPESPWANLRGKELDARGLARRLTNYEIRSAQVWIDGKNVRGFEAASFCDAWTRYLPDSDAAPVLPEEHARSARNARPADDEPRSLAGLADLACTAEADPVPAVALAPGNPCCTVCGKGNLYHRDSIARGVCAGCLKRTETTS